MIRHCAKPENYRKADGTILCAMFSYYRIEDLDEVRAAFRALRAAGRVMKTQVFYRGPRARYASRTRKANATHFVVYPA